MHTCTVTQKAENECLKLLTQLGKKKPHSRLIVTGCAVETLAHHRLLDLGVDLVVTRDQRDELVKLVVGLLGLTQPMGSQPHHPLDHRATLKIQDGCDFNCTYCIIPHTRGTPQSRPFATCLADAQAFIADGFQELVVTGCNIACYEDQGRSLVDLLDALANLPGIGRIRIGSLEPGTIERAVIDYMAQNQTICRFLHLPIQSGTNEILSRMARRYRIEELSDTLSMAFEKMPDLGLGADIITGFPGETSELFEKTQTFLKAWRFSNLHIFPYSERPGTPAVSFEGSIPISERKRRVQVLNLLKARKRSAFAQHLVGRAVQVLIEKIDDKGLAHGWTSEYLACRIESAPRACIGRLVTCVPHKKEVTTLYARASIFSKI